MKHLTKALLLVTLVCSLLLCSCNLLTESEKTFTDSGMTITLTSGFEKNEQDGFTVTYASSKIVVFALKEDFTNFDADTTLEEYADLVLAANQLTDTTVTTENGLTSFTYESEVDGVSYSYLATVHEGEDAFWLIQFATKTNDFEANKEAIITYAKSITLE